MTEELRPLWKRSTSPEGFLTYKFRMEDGVFLVAATKSGIYLNAVNNNNKELLTYGTHADARELASETAEIMRRLVAEYDYLREQNTEE